MINHAKDYKQRFVRNQFNMILRELELSNLSLSDKQKIIYQTIVRLNNEFATDQDRLNARHELDRRKLIINEMLGL